MREQKAREWENSTSLVGRAASEIAIDCRARRVSVDARSAVGPETLHAADASHRDFRFVHLPTKVTAYAHEVRRWYEPYQGRAVAALPQGPVTTGHVAPNC